MVEPPLFLLFKVIWQDLMRDITYDSTKQNWSSLQIVLDESKNNHQVSFDLTVALEKSFYSSKKIIAEKCREQLIKNSTYTQYRGAKIYSPPENDTDIKTLEKEIKLLEKQLKKIDNKKRKNETVINLNQIEEFIKQLSESNSQSFQKDNHIDNQLFEAANKHCDVDVYQSALRNEKNGLRRLIFNSFLIEIEPKEHLNQIFNARTYLILHQIRNKF
ncbi:MAG: hypothetical protein AAFX46_17735 [Cyanobacteria bacterium J06636_27]